MVQPRAVGTAAWCDRVLDAVLVLLATWTLVYHLCLVLRLGVTWAVIVEVAALLAWFLVARRGAAPADEAGGGAGLGEDDRPAEGERRTPPLVVVTVVAAAIAAVGMAVSAPWVLVWVPWLVAAASGTLWAARALRDARATEDPPATPGAAADRVGVGVALAWTAGSAVLATITQRGNPDDLFYLNVSQWVAEHGSFPIRDTLFSNLGYPMANWPPVASYDGLVGAVAHLLGARAATVEYVVVTPLVTALSVLALWRLLRAWRVRQVAIVLSAAMIFLLFDGTGSYGPPGNLFLTRLWQGKVILLCLLVPLMLVHALRFVERPSGRRAVWLAVCGIAATGLSTTAIFLVPVIAVASMAPLVLRDRVRALTGCAALGGYALGAGVVTKALGGRSADDFGARRQYRFDGSWIGHEIFLTGPLALLAVSAVLVGALLVPHRAARVTTGLLVLVTGVVFIPGLTHAAYDATGLGPTLWRLSWGATVAALVGLAVAWVGTRLMPWLTDRLGPRLGRRERWLPWGVAAVALALTVAFGAPIWGGATGTVFRPPFHWQRSSSSRAIIDQILQVTKPGDLVLAPDSLSITLAVTTTDLKSVAPRDYYMYYLRHDPSFHYRDRLTLVRMVNDTGPWKPSQVAPALDVVRPEIACVRIQDVRRYAAIAAAGYTPLLAATYYRCLKRT